MVLVHFIQGKNEKVGQGMHEHVRVAASGAPSGKTLGAARDYAACASLRQVGLLRAISHADLYQLASVTRFQRVENRARLLAVGAAPEYIHFMTQGAGKLSRIDINGRESLLYMVKPGEVFGAPILGTRENDDTTMFVALAPSTVGRVLAKDVESVLGNTKYLNALGQIMSQRLSKAEERLDDMTNGTVSCRMARVVWRLCNEFPRALHCGTKVDVLLTQQDLAGIIGATREVVNTTLRAFRREGWLDIHNRYMCVHERDRLSELVQC
jgi:CRP/FNR family cyclic AMP-dependent transcriptional regulator